MTKRTKVIVAAALATLAFLGVGGYLIYLNQTAESDADLQRQRDGMYSTDGKAVHPSQKPK